MKKDKSLVNEERDNPPRVHGVAIYVAICFGLCALLGWPLAGASFSLHLSQTVAFAIICIGSAAICIPGLVMFIKDQKKLYQYKKTHPDSDTDFWWRMVKFVIFYTWISITAFQAVWMMYDFISKN